MNDNQFDEFFRNKLGKYASNVPDDMWQRISKKDKDRKGFIIVRWSLFALLLLFIGLGSYFILSDNTNEKAGNNFVNNENVKNEKSDENKPSEETVNKKSVVESDDDNDKIPSAKNTNSIIKIGNKIIKQKTLTNSSDSFSSNQFSVSNNICSTDQDHNLNGITINKSNQDSSTSKSSAIKTSVTDSSATAVENSNDPNKNDDEHLDKFSLEFYASPDFPFNNISSDNNRYEQILKDAGKMQLSYSIGARLGIRINDHWSAKIGLQYSQVNEKMNFVDSNLTASTAKNRFKSFDIPLLLSYSKKWSNNLSAAVDAGILLNITSKYKGVISDPYGDAIHIDNSNIYKSNTGVSLYLGIDLSKKISNKTDVFAEPFFRYRIKSITDNLQPFNQKIHAAGISFGVRYRLFKNEE